MVAGLAPVAARITDPNTRRVLAVAVTVTKTPDVGAVAASVYVGSDNLAVVTGIRLLALTRRPDIYAVAAVVVDLTFLVDLRTDTN